MKKIISIGLAAVVVAVLFVGVYRFQRYSNELAPDINPHEDITGNNETVDPTEQIQSINNTNFPLTIPDRFELNIFAAGLGKPRDLDIDRRNALLVSIPEQGRVVALPDDDGDSKADDVITLAQGLDRPHGIAMKCVSSCALYIAEAQQVSVYDYDEIDRTLSNRRVLADLPDTGRHWTRSLAFLPPPHDRQLLVSIGSTCDVCNETDQRHGSIIAVNVETGESEIYARGLRNSVFMTLHPHTGDVWATEMGRDNLGDDLPPDEINIIKEGSNYGWPLCYGMNVHDTEFDSYSVYKRNPCQEPFETPAYINIPAHSAPLGLAFIPDQGWPEEWRDDILIAYHGSWNRTVPTGYKIVRLPLDKNGDIEDDNNMESDEFITGWITREGPLGRPVDLLALPNGVLYISDDRAGLVYRLATILE